VRLFYGSVHSVNRFQTVFTADMAHRPKAWDASPLPVRRADTVARGPSTPFSPERTQDRYVVTSTPGVPEIESELADDSLVELLTMAPGIDIGKRGFATSGSPTWNPHQSEVTSYVGARATSVSPMQDTASFRGHHDWDASGWT